MTGLSLESRFLYPFASALKSSIQVNRKERKERKEDGGQVLGVLRARMIF
jgi:hypothetical protein